MHIMIFPCSILGQGGVFEVIKKANQVNNNEIDIVPIDPKSVPKPNTIKGS